MSDEDPSERQSRRVRLGFVRRSHTNLSDFIDGCILGGLVGGFLSSSIMGRSSLLGKDLDGQMLDLGLFFGRFGRLGQLLQLKKTSAISITQLRPRTFGSALPSRLICSWDPYRQHAFNLRFLGPGPIADGWINTERLPVIEYVNGMMESGLREWM